MQDIWMNPNNKKHQMLTAQTHGNFVSSLLSRLPSLSGLGRMQATKLANANVKQQDIVGVLRCHPPN